MKPALYLLILFILLSFSSNAQMVYSLGNDSTYIRQLEREASRATNDSVAAYTYFRISVLYKRKGDVAKAKDVLEKGKRLIGNSAFLKSASVYYETVVVHVGGDVNQLEVHLLKSDSVLQSFSEPEAFKLRAMIWNTYGIVQQIKGNEKAAMDVFTNKAAAFAERSGDLVVQGKASKSIAIIFMNANQRDKAAPYLLRAIDAVENAPPNPIQGVDLTEIFIIAAENYVLNEQYDSAKWLLDKARRFLDPNPGSNLYLIYYQAEGSYYHKVKDYAAAEESFNKGIAMAEKFNAGHLLNRLKYSRYKTLSAQGKDRDAANVLLDLLQSPLVFTTDKKIYYKDLYTTFGKLNDTKEALRWARKYIVLSDSLHEAKLQKDIIELERKYKESEHLKTIAALNAEKNTASLEARNANLLSWLLGTVSAAMLIAIISGVVLYRQKLKDTRQKQHLQVTKALMQGEETERKRLAADLHDGLGSRLAGVKIKLSQLATVPSSVDQELAQVIQQLDVSFDELRRIARNLMPNVLLKLGLEPALKDMCDSLTSESTTIEFQPFGVNKSIPEEVQVNIYRIVQELLLNAVRHAQASQILVQCSQNGSMFFITLEDNGRGFDTESPQRNGIGLSNIRKRVEYLKGTMDIVSSANEGTTINIEFNAAQQ